MTPKGSRGVARGAAQRNPWIAVRISQPAPDGAEEGAKAPRALLTTTERATTPRESAAPSGAGMLALPRIHGFRSPAANSTRGYNPRPRRGRIGQATRVGEDGPRQDGDSAPD